MGFGVWGLGLRRSKAGLCSCSPEAERPADCCWCCGWPWGWGWAWGGWGWPWFCPWLWPWEACWAARLVGGAGEVGVVPTKLCDFTWATEEMPCEKKNPTGTLDFKWGQSMERVYYLSRGCWLGSRLCQRELLWGPGMWFHSNPAKRAESTREDRLKIPTLARLPQKVKRDFKLTLTIGSLDWSMWRSS